jgi:hypothetical protein
MAGNTRKAKQSSIPVLKTDGELRGIDLPDGPSVLPRSAEWHPLIPKMWEEWRRSPQAQRMGTQLDWYALLRTMMVWDAALKSGKWGMAAPEIRQALALFGETPASRQALKFDAPKADDMAASAGSDSKMLDLEKFRERMKRVG